MKNSFLQGIIAGQLGSGKNREFSITEKLCSREEIQDKSAAYSLLRWRHKSIWLNAINL